MKKLIVLALLAALAMPLTTSLVFTADETAQAGGVTDVGNKVCPVMGGPVNGKDFVVYKGKRYGLCCPGCDKTFLSDPAQYVAKVNAAQSASKEMEKDMEQGSL